MNMPTHQDQVKERYVQMDAVDWVDFPKELSDGGIRWKLLNVSPEMGAWTAIFDCPAGSSFASHHHIGPGEYFLTKGKMEVRGGAQSGGDTAVAPGYGYESCGAFHGKTYFPIDSEFYMTFLGPLEFTNEDMSTKFLATWEKVQAAWEQTAGQ
jgi:acetylacetone-cleaving enzyme